MRMTKKRVRDALSLFIKKDGTPSKPLEEIILELLKYARPNKELYLYTTKGRGRYRHYGEIVSGLIDVVTTVCPEKSIENDAPKGGRLGDYIKFTKKEYDLLLKRLAYVADLNEILEKHKENHVSLKKHEEHVNQAPNTDFTAFNSILDNEREILKEWIEREKSKLHPAPQDVYDIKKKYKVGWLTVERFAKELLCGK